MGAPSLSFMPVITASGDLSEAFPDIDPNYEPFGSLVLLQVRVAKSRINDDSKIVLPDEVRATIQANTQVAKVISCGPIAFKNRSDGRTWPEGSWVKPGDYIRIPLYGGDRWEVKHGDGVIMFRVLRDLDLGGKIPRPLDVIAYV